MTAPTAEKAVPAGQLPVSQEDLIALMREVYQEEQKAADKEILSLDKIKQAFLSLPSEVEREYELSVAKFARNWADHIIKKKNPNEPDSLLEQLLPKDTDELVYGTDAEKIAFAAFAVAINYERLQKNPKEEGALLKKNRRHFGKKILDDIEGESYEHPYFFHLDVLYRMDMAVGAEDAFLMDLLRDARTNSINLCDNHGGQHAYAETVALVFETGSDALRKQLESAPEDWLQEADREVNEAMLTDKHCNKDKKIYAKYFCTRARIQALLGNLDDAIIDVNEAIAREDNTRKDYSIRIGQYSGYYQQFRAQQNGLRIQEQTMAQTKDAMVAQMEEMKKAMDAQMEEMTKAMELQEKESTAKSIEFLGLFSGIVSFTIGSLTITGAIADESIKHAAGLIVVLLGALLCVFAAFGIILHGFHSIKLNKKTQKLERHFMWRHIVVCVIGALVVWGGIHFCLH